MARNSRRSSLTGVEAPGSWVLARVSTVIFDGPGSQDYLAALKVAAIFLPFFPGAAGTALAYQQAPNGGISFEHVHCSVFERSLG